MTSTVKLSLPLLQPSQAQKHVTVNEALSRLDGLTALILVSRSQATPPAVATEGAAYGLPADASGAWEGKGGAVALFLNEGWVFVSPTRGWRAWIADENAPAIHDGANWRAGALALSASGAGCFMHVREFEHAVAPGATSLTSVPIPGPVMVLAVTARVIEPLTGTLSGWRLGSADAEDRFGSGMGLAAGSFANGLLSTPMTYFEPEPLLLTAEDGEFAAGVVRIAVHYFEPSLPGL